MTTAEHRADDEDEREWRTRIADAEAQDAAQWEYESHLAGLTKLEYPTLDDVEQRCPSRD